MEKFYVSLPKQKPFWSDHTSLKIRKLRKMLQTDPHKIHWGFFVKFIFVNCRKQKHFLQSMNTFAKKNSAKANTAKISSRKY